VSRNDASWWNPVSRVPALGSDHHAILVLVGRDGRTSTQLEGDGQRLEPPLTCDRAVALFFYREAGRRGTQMRPFPGGGS